MSSTNIKIVSVIVCTVERPVLLRQCLASIADQELPEGYELEIVVVDNSQDGHNRSLVGSFSASSSSMVRYVHATPQGISYARNAGVQAASGDTVVFIDDDETAASDWLSELLNTAEKYQADIVYGPVYPIFEGGNPPDWDPEGKIMVRDLGLPTGASAPVVYTHNLLIRKSSVDIEEEWFDINFLIGEDADFSIRMAKHGCKMVWCATALVYEFKSKERMMLSYLRRRRFYQGRTSMRVNLKNSDHPVPVFISVNMVRALFKVVFVFFPLLMSYLLTTRNRALIQRYFFFQLGRLLWLGNKPQYLK